MLSTLTPLGLCSMSDSENVSAETSATAKPRQLDVDDMFLFLLDQMQQMNGNITRLLSGDDHSSKPNKQETTHLIVESPRRRM